MADKSEMRFAFLRLPRLRLAITSLFCHPDRERSEGEGSKRDSAVAEFTPSCTRFFATSSLRSELRLRMTTRRTQS